MVGAPPLFNNEKLIHGHYFHLLYWSKFKSGMSRLPAGRRGEFYAVCTRVYRCASDCAYMWRLEKDIGCLPLSLAACLPGDSISHWTGSQKSVFWARPSSQQAPGIFLPLSPCWDYRWTCVARPGSFTGWVRIQPQFLTLAGKGSFPLNHLPQHFKILSIDKCTDRNKFLPSQRRKQFDCLHSKWLPPKAPWNSDSNTDLPLGCFEKQTLLCRGHFLHGYRKQQKAFRVENEGD